MRLDLDNIEESKKIIQKVIEEDWWSQRTDVIRREKEKLINELGFFPQLQEIINSSTVRPRRCLLVHVVLR